MPAGGADVGRQRLAQRGDPGRRAVAGLAVGDRPVHGLDDVGGRRQVDVAEVEREHAIAAAAAQSAAAADTANAVSVPSRSSRSARSSCCQLHSPQISRAAVHAGSTMRNGSASWYTSDEARCLRQMPHSRHGRRGHGTGGGDRRRRNGIVPRTHPGGAGARRAGGRRRPVRSNRPSVSPPSWDARLRPIRWRWPATPRSTAS